MRIAFISANRENMPDAVIPIGLLHVMAAVPERHEKLFWDLCFDSDPLATVADNLRRQQPGLVAIGLRNIQNMDYTNITVNLDYYRRLVATVRTLSELVLPRARARATGDHLEDWVACQDGGMSCSARAWQWTSSIVTRG